jgi:DNA-directed RNA polymerase specialized sigma24 family protein
MLHNSYFDLLVRRGQVSYGMRLEDAEELADDVLFALLMNRQRARTVKNDQELRYWVLAIFRNKAVDRYRAALRERNRSGLPVRFDQTSEWANLSGVNRRSWDPVEEVENREMMILNGVIDEMQPWERSLLHCRALGMPFTEIAGYVGKRAVLLKVYHGRVLRRCAREVLKRSGCYQSPI